MNQSENNSRAFIHLLQQYKQKSGREDSLVFHSSPENNTGGGSAGRSSDGGNYLTAEEETHTKDSLGREWEKI